MADLTMYRGDDRSLLLTIAPADSIDWDTATFRFVASTKNDGTGEPVIDLSSGNDEIEIVDEDAGTVRVLFASSVTADLTAPLLYWQLVITSGADRRTLPDELSGILRLVPPLVEAP